MAVKRYDRDSDSSRTAAARTVCARTRSVSWSRYAVLSGVSRPSDTIGLRARRACVPPRESTQVVCRLQTAYRLTLPGRAA